LATVINGVDLDEQDRRVTASPLARARLGLGPDVAVLGSVARFDPVKRLAALVGALQFLDRPGVARLLVGDGPEPDRPRRGGAAGGALCDEPERARGRGGAGRARVGREFGIRPMVEKTAEIYGAAAASHR